MHASSSKGALNAFNTARSTTVRPLARSAARPVVSAASIQLPKSKSLSKTPQRTFFSLPDISKLANIASNANEEQGIEMDGEVQRFHARKILPYTQEQLYSIVSDVPSYSDFIPFCTGSTVLAPRSHEGPRKVWKEWKPTDKSFDVDAELKVGFGGLEEKYISKVVGRPFESVTATASEQTPLFKSLTTSWSFAPASSHSPHPSAASTPASSTQSDTSSDPTSGPTLLTIDLAFAFANPLHRIASQAVLPRVADKMVEAFEKRCLAEWGKGKQ